MAAYPRKEALAEQQTRFRTSLRRALAGLTAGLLALRFINEAADCTGYRVLSFL
jgi:hypothetical protein